MALMHLRNLPAAALAVVAAYLMWLAPDRVFGIDSGVLGSALLLATAWLVVWLWRRVAAVAEDHASLGQQLALLGLGFSVAIGISFLARLQRLGWSLDPSAAETWVLGRNVLLMLILWPISAAILRSLRRDEGIEDERDRAIATRASAHAYSVLAIAVIALIVQLGFGGAAFQALANPVSVAHWLIGLLIVSTVAEHLSATLQYRRDQP
jgi:uncharacterized membrane protein